MAVPKTKASKAKSRSRRAGNWRLAKPACSARPPRRRATLPHVLCRNSGWYGGRQAVDVG